MFSFRNWRKPKWQHSDPEIRRRAIEQLQDTDTLLEVLDNDADDSLRLLALEQIDDGATLERLLEHDLDAVRNRARERRLDQLCPGGDSTALATLDSESELLLVAQLTDDDALREAAVSRLENPDRRLELAHDHPSANVRYTAALGIVDIERLEELSRKVKTKDKRVFRLCRERIDEHRALERERHRHDESVAAWLAQAERVARIEFNAETNKRIVALETQWAAIGPNASEGQRLAAEHELSRLQRLQSQHAQAKQAQVDHNQARAEAQNIREHIVLDLRNALQNTRRVVVDDMQNIDLASPLLAEVARAQTRWHAAAPHAAPTSKELREFEQSVSACQREAIALQKLHETAPELSSQVQNLQASSNDSGDLASHSATLKHLDATIRKLDWPNESPKPRVLVELHELRAKNKAAIDTLQDAERQLTEELEHDLQKMTEALDEGQVKTAQNLSAKLHLGVKQLSSRHAKSLSSKLQGATTRLRSMQDWQAFATTPKKQELCERMEALLGEAESDLDLRAERIKSLQAAWRELGGGGNRADRELWTRFKAAADEAYEPCREHFEQLGKVRLENLAQRNDLCEQLQEYESRMDWQAPDWEKVQQTLDAARAAFREYSPVERTDHRKSQRRFQQITDKIYRHIKSEYERNIDAKSRLIEQAKALIEHEQVHEAVDTAKSLQEQWRSIGIVPRGRDQKLWREFRAACDSIFARRDDERQARQAVVDETISSAQKLLDEAREHVRDGPLTDARSKLDELTIAVRELELPRRVSQQALAELSELADSLRGKERAAQSAAAQARWQALVDLLRACGIAADGDSQTAENLWNANWNQSKLPTGVDVSSIERCYRGDSLLDDQEQLRHLCIQMEILADLESPQSDQQLRMQVQVQRLAGAMGGQHSPAEERLEILNRCFGLRLNSDACERLARALMVSVDSPGSAR